MDPQSNQKQYDHKDEQWDYKDNTEDHKDNTEDHKDNTDDHKDNTEDHKDNTDDHKDNAEDHKDNTGDNASKIESISDEDAEESKTRQFDAGQLAVQGVAVLMWIHIGLQIYKLYDQFSLSIRLRTHLKLAAPALKTPSEGNYIHNWLIVLLAFNLATAVANIAVTSYMSIVYILRGFSKSAPPESWTKQRFRTIGTLWFYVVLLPESLLTLLVSAGMRTLSQIISRRISTGQLPAESVEQLMENFSCPVANGTCWNGEGTGQAAKLFFEPVKWHLRYCYLPEAFFHMGLILVIFLVTHVVRTRGGWETDHRRLLRRRGSFFSLPMFKRTSGDNGSNNLGRDFHRRAYKKTD